MQYIIKIILSAILIVAISELAKRSSFMGAILASLPMTSILAFVFLYYETQDSEKVSALSTDIFWLVIPSLTLFLVLAQGACRQADSLTFVIFFRINNKVILK